MPSIATSTFTVVRRRSQANARFSPAAVVGNVAESAGRPVPASRTAQAPAPGRGALRFWITVTGTRAGYTTTAKTSTATAAVVAAPLALTTPVPTVTGTAKVGSALTAVPGTWGPAPVALSYQWYCSGVLLIGAAAATRTLTATDAGATLTVRVTGSRTGYTTIGKTSGATAKIAS